MELTCLDVNYRLVKVFERFDSAVDVEDLPLLAISVETCAQLEAIVLADAVGQPVLAEVEGVLEAERHLDDSGACERLHHARVIAVDVVLQPELRAVVVAPREDAVQLVDDVDEAAAHLEQGDVRVLEYGFQLWRVYAGLEEGRESLDAANEPGHCLKVVDEAVGAP